MYIIGLHLGKQREHTGGISQARLMISMLCPWGPNRVKLPRHPSLLTSSTGTTCAQELWVVCSIIRGYRLSLFCDHLFWVLWIVRIHCLPSTLVKWDFFVTLRNACGHCSICLIPVCIQTSPWGAHLLPPPESNVLHLPPSSFCKIALRMRPHNHHFHLNVGYSDPWPFQPHSSWLDSGISWLQSSVGRCMWVGGSNLCLEVGWRGRWRREGLPRIMKMTWIGSLFLY